MAVQVVHNTRALHLREHHASGRHDGFLDMLKHFLEGDEVKYLETGTFCYFTLRCGMS